MEQTACEGINLKAFERRLTEVISQMQPSASRWRALLLSVSICAAIGAYQWLTDPSTKEVSFSYSLFNHIFFTASLLLLLLLFLCGIHKRVVAPSIISSRCRQCLADFNMSCDDFAKTFFCMDQWVWNDFVDLFNTVVFAVITVFIVFGGVIPYYFQHREIRRTQNAKGFSLFVCLTLLASNVLRIMFWFGKRFEIQLLIQSVVIIICMLAMIDISVRVGRRQTLPPNRHFSVWDGDFVTHFWAWSDFSSYLITTTAFMAISLVITYALLDVSLYIESIGFLALFLEANLGSPQFLSNWSRKSTLGMSMSMVALWMLGDVSKTIYFIVRQTPAQFWLCGMLQVGVDIAIISQIYLYKGMHEVTKSSSHL